MKSKIEINISVIDDGPVVMRCQGQNTSKGKALDALEDAYLSTVAQLMRKDLSKAEQEEAAKEFGETMQDRLLAMVRGKGKRYMVSSEKEMSFMTELMRCQGQNTSKGKALDALEDAYLSTVAQLMRKDLSKAEQEEAAKEFGETMQDRLLAMVRGKGKRYMVSSEKEMSFMTELMRRKGEVQP